MTVHPADHACDHKCHAPILRMAGLRPTRQRLLLSHILFGGEPGHWSAEALYNKAREHLPMTLSTVYNTLNEFAAAGLIRSIAVSSMASLFDTNVSNHSHFLDEATGELLDIPDSEVRVLPPSPPAGYRVVNVDVLVHVRPDADARSARAIRAVADAPGKEQA